jgi:integration host factor subunit alpha
MALTKAMIVDGIHEQLGYPKNKSAEMLETLLELIKSNLEKGEDVLISGFGKFCVKEKNERRGRNPATGNDMLLDSATGNDMLLDRRRVVTFRCSHLLRDKINGQF